jgi:hypothetical protein
MEYRNQWKKISQWKKINFSLLLFSLNIITIDINHDRNFYMFTILNFTYKNR